MSRNLYYKKWQQSAAGKEYYHRKQRTAAGRHNSLKTSARVRGILVSITREQHSVLVSLPCHYCLGPLNPTGSGLDRLDSSKGYEEGNVVPCCKGCNTQKGNIEMAGFTFPRSYELMLELKGRLR
jgi:hypothetical protein